MSRAKIFNMIKNRGTSQNGRNTFDLSGFESYSEKCQMINPIRVIDTIPNDYFNIKVNDFIQCAGPLKAASFVRGSREIAAYYIPYNSIWHNFNQYQATREDPDSTLLQQKGIVAEPRFSLFGMYIQVASFFAEWINYRYITFAANLTSTLSSLQNFPTGDELYDIFTNPSNYYFKNALDAAKAIQITNKDNFFLTTMVGKTNLATNDNVIIQPAFYNMIADGGIGYTTAYLWSSDMVGNPCWADACRKLDMLGYGNIYPVFDYAYRLWNDSSRATSWAYLLDNLANVSSASDLQAAMGALNTTVRLIMQNIVFQLKSIVNTSSTAITDYTSKFDDQYVNIYPMYAYNRCFYDMFRNSYYDLDYDVRNYNADFVNCQNMASTIIYPIHTYPRFWKLESHQYKKDMFTGVLPDTQFGAVSSIDLSGINIYSDSSYSSSRQGVTLDGTNALARATKVSVYDTNSNEITVQATNPSSSTWSIPSAFDVFAFRRAECLQQYRMDLLRAGNKTRDIFKQIYGSNPKSELDEAPYFIDVFGQSLKIDPIIATSETGQGNNGSLGDIAARITTRGDGSFKFSTQDFGCILILDYTLIDPSYNSVMIDAERFNLSQEMHFIPQLQNLGFEAVFGLQLNMYKSGSIKTRTIGYAPPYLCKKTYIDKVHGNMCSVILPSKISDVGGIQILGQLQNHSYVGNRSIWTVTRKDMQEAVTVELRHFYGNPNILDDVMIMQYDPTFDSDQFICHTMIEVNAVRQLSELGLPRFC